LNAIRRRALRKVLSLLSLVFFPVTFYYFSPVVPLAGAFSGIVAGSLIVFATLFVSALFLGRGFCSWVCPAGALQDLAGESRNKAFPRKYGWVKFLLWFPWLGLMALLFMRAGGVGEVDFLFLTDRGISVSDRASLAVYLVVALTFFLLPLLLGKRAACHLLCWMAPFMVIGERLGRGARIPGIGIRHGDGNCVSCGACARACPMGVDIDCRAARKEALDATSDCVLCGACVEACPRGALAYGAREAEHE